MAAGNLAAGPPRKATQANPPPNATIAATKWSRFNLPVESTPARSTQVIKTKVVAGAGKPGYVSNYQSLTSPTLRVTVALSSGRQWALHNSNMTTT